MLRRLPKSPNARTVRYRARLKAGLYIAPTPYDNEIINTLINTRWLPLSLSEDRKSVGQAIFAFPRRKCCSANENDLIISSAYAVLERDHEREHQEWLERHYDPILGRVDLGEDQEIEQPPQQQRSSEELVYKTHTPPAQSREDQIAGWNAWADSRIAKFLDENLFTENQRETLGYVIADMRQEWRQDIEQKLGELRAEVEILRSIVKAGNVEQLVRETNAG